jgi:predicted Zn-dependent protease
MRSTARTRLLLAVVALAMVAWLAILLRDLLLIRRVAEIARTAHPTQAQIRRGLLDARDSALLNPNRSLPLLSQAVIYQAARDSTGMIRIYERMLRAEPEDADIWYLLASTAQTRDPRLSAAALAHVRRLDPRF